MNNIFAERLKKAMEQKNMKQIDLVKKAAEQGVKLGKSHVSQYPVSYTHLDVYKRQDQIIASQYLLLPNLDEMKGHAFESLDPDFSKKVKPGDFVVGGENFGCGSSREQAPGVLKALGVQAVVAKSFARIFYRNSINIGLPVIVCKDLPDEVNTGDKMVLHMSEGTVEANGKTYSCTKLPEYMQNILNQGGLIASLNKEEK